MDKNQKRILIENFMRKGKEGDYWDFKQEWHEHKGELIKDIVCFANTVHDKDCYLIFGVSDSLEITGMKKERRKQADILDMLSTINFAGDIVPRIEVDTVILEGKEVDILTIFNVEKTPIYLKKSYHPMQAGCVYTRVGDRNSPNDIADIDQIEYLWKKRFGLLKPALDYIFERLKHKEEWKESGDYYYNIYRPEYMLHKYYNKELESLKDEFYFFTQVDESASYLTLDIICCGTVIDSYQIALLDGGRLSIPISEWGFIKLDSYNENTKSYKYYIRESNRFKLLEFMYDIDNSEQRTALYNLLKVVLVFNSDTERDAFENYISLYPEKILDKIKEIDDYNYIETGSEKRTLLYKEQLHRGIALKNLLEEWRLMEL